MEEEDINDISIEELKTDTLSVLYDLLTAVVPSPDLNEEGEQPYVSCWTEGESKMIKKKIIEIIGKL